MKKILSIALVVVLLAGIAVSGTMAYLTDTDSAVNVMTLGNVKIEQHEKERVDMTEQSKIEPAKLQDFTQGQPLYPAVLEMEGKEVDDQQCWAPGGAEGALEDHYVNWGDFVTADVAEGSSAWNGVWGTSLKNVIDKFVFVENTGKSDCYYRTIILMEYDETETKNSYGQSMIHYNYNGNSLFSWERFNENGENMTVTVNGEVYNYIVATYNNPLKPGTVSRPSLLQVGLDGEATNEIVEQFGDTYEILVLSQAVQTAGFDSADEALNAGFGEVTEATVAEWFGGVAMPWDGTIPETAPESLKIEPGATESSQHGTIIVNDAEGLIYLSELSKNWVALYSNGQGTSYTDYDTNKGGKGTDYYYKWTWAIKLNADIDLGGKTISPIALGKFGKFDGQGHTIKNAKVVTDTTEQTAAALFTAENMAFSNLKLDNIHVEGSNVGNSTAAILVSDPNGAVDKITIKNSSVCGGKYTGAVVGYNYGSVTNCTVEKCEVKGGYKLGGIIGYICASGTNNDVTGNKLINCTVDGIGDGVYAGGKDKYVVGKVVGNYNCDGSCTNNTVTNMTTSATSNIGEIEAGKTVVQ